MNKVEMPEHIGSIWRKNSGEIHFKQNGDPYITDGITLITTAQAEAYAQACVKEALEEAADIADQNNAFHVYDAIRALIKSTPA